MSEGAESWRAQRRRLRGDYSPETSIQRPVRLGQALGEQVRRGDVPQAGQDGPVLMVDRGASRAAGRGAVHIVADDGRRVGGSGMADIDEDIDEDLDEDGDDDGDDDGDGDGVGLRVVDDGAVDEELESAHDLWGPLQWKDPGDFLPEDLLKEFSDRASLMKGVVGGSHDDDGRREWPEKPDQPWPRPQPRAQSETVEVQNPPLLPPLTRPPGVRPGPAQVDLGAKASHRGESPRPRGADSALLRDELVDDPTAARKDPLPATASDVTGARAEESSHRTAAAPETTGAGAEEAEEKEAPEDSRFSLNNIRTSALVLAAGVLLLLGATAHWVSNRSDDMSRSSTGHVSISPPPSAHPASSTGVDVPTPQATASPSTSMVPSVNTSDGTLAGHSSDPSQTRPTPVGQVPVRTLAAAPSSSCTHFMETNGQLDTVKISVQNACQ
jgi:hypothetical protein